MPTDLMTIVLLAGSFLGLVIADATFFGDPLMLTVTLPPKAIEQGVTEAGAEAVFAQEVARIHREPVLVPTPTINVSSESSLFATFAKPFGLQNAVVGLQRQIGRDVVQIDAMVTESDPGTGLGIVVLVKAPDEKPIALRLSQPDGDAVTLLHRASRQTLEDLAPYWVAVADFVEGQTDPAALTRARELAARALAKPYAQHRATERAMLHNLLGIAAIGAGDWGTAETELKAGAETPLAMPVARGVIALNRAFVAVALHRPEVARAEYLAALAGTRAIDLPGVRSHVLVTAGLVAWSMGDIAQAAKLLREAAAADPGSRLPYDYLERLLAGQGDRAGAEAARTAAAALAPLDRDRLPSLAVSLYFLDPGTAAIGPLPDAAGEPVRSRQAP
jgi:hypothetical protein